MAQPPQLLPPALRLHAWQASWALQCRFLLPGTEEAGSSWGYSQKHWSHPYDVSGLLISSKANTVEAESNIRIQEENKCIQQHSEVIGFMSLPPLISVFVFPKIKIQMDKYIDCLPDVSLGTGSQHTTIAFFSIVHHRCPSNKLKCKPCT